MIRMTRHAIILSLVFAFLLFGCAGPSETAPAGVQGQVPADTGVAPAAQDATGAPPSEGAPDLTNLAYAELVALGVPIQCDVVTIVDGETVNTKMYMKGEDEIRIESMSTQPDCPKVISIFTEDVMYVGCEGQQILPDLGCDWMKFEAEEETSATESAPVTASDLEDLPPTSYSCQPWIYDSSKFTASGKACTMEDIMQGYYVP